MAGEKGVGNSSEAESQPPGPAVAGSSRPVFISYASNDAAVAQKVCSALEAAGIFCWIAPRDVVPGTLYADGIVGALDESSILVLILSKDAVASAHVGRELERATSKRHPIIALRTDSAPLNRAFEYFLNQSQWIEVSAGGAGAAIAKLVEAVHRHLALGSTVATSPAPQGPLRKPAMPRRVWVIAGALVALVLIAIYFVADKAWLHGHGAAPGIATGPSLAVGDKSIAVLPFTDMSEKKDQEYFADGMAEEIIDLLVKIPGLKVISRTSSFQFKGQTQDLRAIGRQLGVAYLLEGSVRKSGDRLRVTAQLIDSRDGSHLFSQTYDRDLSDTLKMQDEIAIALVRALQIEVRPGEIALRPALRNTESYTLFLQGSHAFDRNDQQGLEQALSDFQGHLISTRRSQKRQPGSRPRTLFSERSDSCLRPPPLRRPVAPQSTQLSWTRTLQSRTPSLVKFIAPTIGIGRTRTGRSSWRGPFHPTMAMSCLYPRCKRRTWAVGMMHLSL
jgi:TolB-like protein